MQSKETRASILRAAILEDIVSIYREVLLATPSKASVMALQGNLLCQVHLRLHWNQHLTKAVSQHQIEAGRN